MQKGKTIFVKLLQFLFLMGILTGCQNLKPLPEGVSFNGETRMAEQITFLSDQTWVDADGKRFVEQTIFDDIFDTISQAREFILLDMFLYNPFQGKVPETTRALSGELTEALLSQKKNYPDIQIILISDPVNTVYGGMESEQFTALEAAGVEVVITNLDALRDSNAFYSFFWRLFIRPFGNSYAHTLPNPLGDGKVSARSYLKLINFKANHRKILIADQGDDYVGLVTSANPHDGSSAHRNVALKFNGNAVSDLLETEKAVLALSDHKLEFEIPLKAESEQRAHLKVITEKQILNSVLEAVNQAGEGDALDLMMFYLSERSIVKALKAAVLRGADLRVVLDPNKDAFGREKNGIPNRQVAKELHDVGAPVLWCDTHGEQCHAKMLIARYQNGEQRLIMGSANFTRRNLDNYNLETDVLLKGTAETAAIQAAQAYFDESWFNRNNRILTTEYATYEDKSLMRRWLYRFMEFSGLSTF